MSEKTANLVKDLAFALQVGNYDSSPGNLEYGSPLQVEDLSVTLEKVIFKWPEFFMTRNQYIRMLKRMREHNVKYHESHYLWGSAFPMHCVDLYVGSQEPRRKIWISLS